MKSKYRRGYPVAILIGIDADHASIWQIYSQIAKLEQTVAIDSSCHDQKSTYNFYERVINALRPIVKEGIRSIIVASPPRTNYANELLSHIKNHHAWLTPGNNRMTISIIEGSASTRPQVALLTQKITFKEHIQDNLQKETDQLIEVLEKRLNISNNLVFFSLEEAERLVISNEAQKLQAEYILLTDDYLARSRQRHRLQRLMQIAQNKKIKTRVINVESTAGTRLKQLGGIVCLAKSI